METFTRHFNEVDRVILEGKTEGFVRVHVRKGSDKIIGETIVAPNAGDMISELTLANTHGLGLKQIANTIHPYPTKAEAIRQVAGAYNRSRLTTTVKSLFPAGCHGADEIINRSIIAVKTQPQQERNPIHDRNLL